MLSEITDPDWAKYIRKIEELTMSEDMSALEEAQEFKRVLERHILTELKRFTDISGLVVEDITIVKRCITHLGDAHPKFIYGAELEIKV